MSDVFAPPPTPTLIGRRVITKTHRTTYRGTIDLHRERLERRQKNVRLLTDVRDRLRAKLAERHALPPARPTVDRPWTDRGPTVDRMRRLLARGQEAGKEQSVILTTWCGSKIDTRERGLGIVGPWLSGWLRRGWTPLAMRLRREANEAERAEVARRHAGLTRTVSLEIDVERTSSDIARQLGNALDARGVLLVVLAGDNGEAFVEASASEGDTAAKAFVADCHAAIQNMKRGD